jgi:hypothetical protein
MTHDSALLKDILKLARNLMENGQKSLAVFDLDSTLFDVSPRLQQILNEFCTIPQFQKKYPEHIPLVAKAKTQRTDWGFKKALERAGFDNKHPEFEKDLKEFWHQRFFSNKYLDFDVPYDGAVDFVVELEKCGSDIVYLTGRDIQRMGQGTAEILDKWKFPKGQLALKPHKSMDDAQFKSDFFANLKDDQYKKIWFFENEPLNVNLVRSQHQQVEIIFFDSTHCGEAEAPQDLPRLLHYIMED